MANEIRIRASVKDDASRPVKGIKGQITQLQAGAKQSILTGVGMGAGIGAFTLMTSAVDGAVNAIGSAVQASSALEQSTGAIESVLGSAAGIVQKFGDTSADSYGLSRRAVQELGAVTAASLKGLGLSATQAARTTVDLQKRAADLAATFGGPVEDAVSAMNAALRGERDPIERYGISIKQADVNARVLAMGLDTGTAAAKKNAEAQATLALIMEQSADAAGAFARESDQLAGIQARAAARAEDAMADFGHEWNLMVASIVNGALKVADAMKGVGDFLTQEVDLTAIPGNIANFFKDAFEEDIPTSVKSGMETANTEATTAANAMARGALDATTRIAATWDAKMNALPNSIRDQFAPIRGAAFQTQVEYAKGLADAQDAPRVQMEALRQMQKDVLTRAQEEARLRGQLNSAALARGLADERPAVRAQAEATRLAIINQLDSINGAEHGRNIAHELAGGLNQGYGVVVTAAGHLASAVRGQIGINSEPSDPTSPLRGITRWGKNIAGELAKGMASGAGAVRGAAGGLGGGVTLAGAGATAGGTQVIQLVLDGRVLAEVIDGQQNYRPARAGVLPRS